MTFDPVSKDFDLPQLEREVIDFWSSHDVVEKYLSKNDEAGEQFRFLDGPITANGPMGVHHAWGRTYKDLWQRYNTMLGKRQRYQNGFDCQGLWVEVTVERQLGFNSKRDIEQYGIANFVRRCKQDVYRYAGLITKQSQRLGHFMDWDNSYFTLSDENNYTIWHFLKTCYERGLIYRGTDVMPWCTRCGTGLSEHEIATDGYQELTHRSVYVRFPLKDREEEYLLVWTTTPWTLTSNVAVAVNPDISYSKVEQGAKYYYLASGALGALRGDYRIVEHLTGADLVGCRYDGPFDDLPAEAGIDHQVIPWNEVSEEEGTGLVHIAPGCGKEDFALGKDFDLPVVAPLDQDGVYAEGFGWLTGRNVQDVTGDIIADLESKGLLYRAHDYAHRYPTCWRCQTELVFRLVEEWFIAMDPLREPMMDVARQVRWIPAFGLERELDWLRNMDDWMISKKRYWGLALPFWFCPNDHMTVIGGKEELFERGLTGLDELESPHRPWIDEVTIACPECGEQATRIPDVGNVWLDAGIVPFSTIGYDTDRDYWREWFPADFITESFPGQFRNWFYSMLAMSTVLEDSAPFRTALGYALMRDQHGREMHKSWGNLIPFDEAAERAGADSMRWLFALHNPEHNLNFGWEPLEEVRRRLLLLWNTYYFFVTYANLDGWRPAQSAPQPSERPLLDRWVLSRLMQVTLQVRRGLDSYDAMNPARSIERFIEELSTWYVRRSRRRFWKSENDGDKSAAYATLYECLVTLSRLLAPFMPFLAEHLYQNLSHGTAEVQPESVHLTSFPRSSPADVDEPLLTAMELAQRLVALGRAARERANIKIRQPIARMYVHVSQSEQPAVNLVRHIVLDELNVKEMEFADAEDDFLTYTLRPNLPVLGPRLGKLVPQLRAELDRMDPTAAAQTLLSGDPLHIQLDGTSLVLNPSDVLVSAVQRPGYAAMAEDGYLVALDTEMSPELRREGYVREVVRHINNWRKEAGFNVEERVEIEYEASSELAAAISEHREYIAQETLAHTLREVTTEGHGFHAHVSFSGETLVVSLRHAAPLGRL